MTKRGIIAALAFGLIVSPVAAVAAPPTAAADDIDPAKLILAREIVTIVLPPEQRDKMMAGALDAMMKNMIAGSLQGNGLDSSMADNPKLKAIFAAFVSRQRDLALADLREAMPGLVEAYARAYSRMFSIDDLQAIAVFVKTPAGAHFVQRGPSLLSDPDVGKWQRDLAAKGAARQPAELARFKAEIMAARPDKPSGT